MGFDPADIKREQNSRFKLGTLLQKERSERKSQLVDQIVCSALSLEEKINRIMAIDAKPDEEPSPREKAKPAEKPIPEKGRADLNKSESEQDRKKPEDVIEPEDGETLDAPPNPPTIAKTDSYRLVRRQKTQFFVEPIHGGLIRWFFRDLKRVRLFGEATDTIARNTFPFTLKIDPKLNQWLQRDLQKGLVPPILDYTQALLKKSWVFLDKRAYNSIVVAQDLLLAIKRAQFTADTSAGLRASLNQFIGQFVYLLYDRDTLSFINDSMEEAASRLAISHELRKSATQAFRDLFRNSISSCTLENACLGIIMLYSHRYLETSDLYRSDAKKLTIPADAFECSADIQKEIDHVIEKRFLELREVHESIADLQFFHAFLPSRIIGDKLDLDLSALYQFLGPADSDVTHNPALWAMRIHDRYAETFTSLLTEGPLLDQGIRPRIFPKGLIQAQISRMAMLMERLAKASTIHPEFSRTRFDKLHHARHEADPAELELLDIIVEYTSLLVSLGKNLADVIKTRSLRATVLYRSKAPPSEEDALPYEGAIITQPEGLSGKSVIESIILAVSIAWQGALSLGETELKSKWQQLQPQLAHAAERLADIERLASITQYEALTELINSPM